MQLKDQDQKIEQLYSLEKDQYPFKKDNSNQQINNENEEEEKLINYQIKIIYHIMKCPIFQLLADDKILYTAKRHYHYICIGEGEEVHINKSGSIQVAKIHQEHDRTNFIMVNKTRFQLKYVESNKPKNFSLSVTFPNENKNVTWKPKRSDKNCVLENTNGQTEFVLKKMTHKLFEIETLQSIDPLMIFTIGLSGIIGPHDEPFGGF